VLEGKDIKWAVRWPQSSPTKNLWWVNSTKDLSAFLWLD